MQAICTGCSALVYWRAGRGARLSLIRCPVCGSGLRGKTGKDGIVLGQTIRCIGCPRDVEWRPEDAIELDRRWGLCPKHARETAREDIERLIRERAELEWRIYGGRMADVIEPAQRVAAAMERYERLVGWGA
jgi:hypothetical protein